MAGREELTLFRRERKIQRNLKQVIGWLNISEY